MTDPDAGGKHCTKCGEWKTWDGFPRNRSRKDGRRSQCKLCAREWREVNRDSIAEKDRKYSEANRDKIAEYKRKHYEKNRDAIVEYRKANREKTMKYMREYRKENRDKIARKDREYREANRDNPQFKAARAARIRTRRSRKRSLPSETVLLREIALRDGATCWICGDELSEWNPAHLDHLVPLSASTELLEAWGMSNPGTVRANMALGCPTCNIRKSNRLMPCALARYLRNLSAESEIAA